MRPTGELWPILVTVDYELFGDGTGSVDEHMIRPLDDLILLWDRLEIRATVFVEVAELLAFEEAVSTRQAPEVLGRQLMAIRSQLRKLLEHGHDLQLHVHPQWQGATWERGAWKLGTDHYGLLRTGAEGFSGLLSRAKAYLEAIAADVRPDYKCRVFRAGALHFDRQEESGRLLASHGIEVDSSVCRGYVRNTRDSKIDYSDLLENRAPFWPTLDGSSIDEEDAALWEVPVWSVMKAQWHKLTPRRLTNKLVSVLGGADAMSQAGHTGLSFSNPRETLSWLATKQPIMWDFCNLPASGLNELLKTAMAFHLRRNMNPLVMIGHTKEFSSGRSLVGFAEAVREDPRVQWWTMDRLADRLKEIATL
jgi:hypothetical protein